MTTVQRDWLDVTEERLREAGHRTSGPRSAIIEVMSRQECCLTAREIADRVREDGRPVGTATVYRALELLHAMGAVQRLDAGQGFARYEPAEPSGEHHHHVLCDDCGGVFAFEDRALERAIDDLSKRLAFDIAAHDVVLRGSCGSCSAAAR